MLAKISFRNKEFRIDLSKPLDISIPLQHGMENPNAFYAFPPDFSPFVSGNFIGKVTEGAPVNFFNVKFNPHGNGTHTESYGHISPEQQPVNRQLIEFHFLAEVITITPGKSKNGDNVISGLQVRNSVTCESCNALVIRTLPNTSEKLTAQYGGTNPPYLDPEVMDFLIARGIDHLLIDLPSVDREEDGGKLSAHRRFWSYPENPRENATITEMIYVPDLISDGIYLLNLQIAPFELDASPSKPVLYKVIDSELLTPCPRIKHFEIIVRKNKLRYFRACNYIFPISRKIPK